MKLAAYLDNKPLYYDTIDYDRMPLAYEEIKKSITLPKIIHIVGTNGKGSSGRFLAQMLQDQGHTVGHYTSPHIFKFNERIWLNGHDASDDVLETSHQRLQQLLSQTFIDTLSYFEYTTFLAMMVFSKRCEFVVLEAGLGGEHDGTNIFPKIMSLFTPIGLDHQSFLGTTIKEIATTKLNSMASQALVATQYDAEVNAIAKEIAKKRHSVLYFTKDLLNEEETRRVHALVEKKQWPKFQTINLSSALCVMKLLGFSTHFHEDALTLMAGRCQKIVKNVTLDVGHNPMAAKAIVAHFHDKKINLIYNSFIDKNYEEILHILAPIIKKVELLRFDNPRGMADKEIRKICDAMSIDVIDFEGIKQEEAYLVFGSFSVVEQFLKVYHEG
ncbi:Mur ligase family protein [Sulfurospirillum sp. 1612]|uniref:Mur ligase family protein n=1 Tax=Sulfurospirillum sp. 1612 TaxID=3094835 RepID=UPI002F9230F9